VEDTDMAELKTKKTTASVADFLNSIKDESRREECRTIARLMQRAMKTRPKMWGSSIVGFGEYHYKYGTGREGDWFVMGFSPRAQNLTLYLLAGVKRDPTLLKQLGKHSTGQSCLYIKRLADVDLSVLEKMIAASTRLPERTRTGQ
jgi:hypothetical protein